MSCSTKDILTRKHLRSVIKHTLMNKLSYVNKKALQKYIVFIVIISSHNYSLDFQIPTYNAHHTHLMQEIPKNRFL